MSDACYGSSEQRRDVVEWLETDSLDEVCTYAGNIQPDWVRDTIVQILRHIKDGERKQAMRVLSESRYLLTSYYV